MSQGAKGGERRVIVIVIDGCGVGAAPDAAAFGDSPECNTLENVAVATSGLKLPHLANLGLGNIASIRGVEPVPKPLGFFGKLEESSRGKDTQTGHWEMMGVVSETAFPLYPKGFPLEVLNGFIEQTGCGGILGNKPASGTEIIEELGRKHQETGHPIVYTSGDSVFQVACHVATVPLERQYSWCKTARRLLDGEHRVGRVICRPFTGEPGKYRRLGGDRRDYSVPPPAPTLLDRVRQQGMGVLGIGKIEDIFAKQGISHAIHTGSNREGLDLTLQAIDRRLDLGPLAIVDEAPDTVRFVFTNLVDTDMLYGHRRNAEGYAQALEEIDEWLPQALGAMGDGDLLVISSDHGNDPTAPGTDHTREYVPLICFSPALCGLPPERLNLGVRDGFVDIAASLAVWLDIPWQGPGVSFIPELSRVG